MNSNIYSKVLLIRVDLSELSATHPRHLHPPVDILLVKKGLEDNGIQCDFYDEWIDGSSAKLSDQTIAEYDLVVIKGSSFCQREVWNIGKRIKEITTVWCVGQVTSHLNERNESDWKSVFKKIFISEFESSLLEEILHPTSERIIKKLSSPENLPLITLTGKQMEDYSFPFPLKDHKIKKWGYLMSAWGCPYMNKCTFCSPIVRKSDGSALRIRGVEKVIEDLKYQRDQGAEAFCFEDDTLLTNKRYIMSLFNEMEKQNLNYPWLGSVRINELDDERIDGIFRSGGKLLKIGIESGSPRIVEKLGKGVDGDTYIAQVKERTKKLKDKGIGFIGLMMVGNPDESIEDIALSNNLISQIRPDYLQVQILTPYPDSPLYEQLQISNSEQDFYHYKSNDFGISQFDAGELLNIQKSMYKKYYMRPQFISNHIIKNRKYYLSSDGFKFILNKGRLILKNLI